MNQLNFVRLAVMMFLQFFVWGAWYVTAPNYLGTIGFKGTDFGWTYSVGPIAGMLTPLFVGMVADRYFSAQKVLGVLHLLGAGIMLLATSQMQSETPNPNVINAILLGYMLTYFPTLALTSTIAMRNMTNPEKEFPYIRVFGTIGWILAGLYLTFSHSDRTIAMFHTTIAAAGLLGILSFFLPSTPPVRGEKVTVGQLLGVDAFRLFKDRSYLTFMIASVLICIPLAFYYQLTSRLVEMSGLPIGQTMSYGQISEIFFMLVMPLFFARLGVKWMLVVGMLAWVIRYALFAFGASSGQVSMIVIGIILHGICYDFFFVTGQIYTDKKAPPAIRGQAQGLLVMLTLGLGMLIGAQTAGQFETRYTTPESIAFSEQVVSKNAEIAQLRRTADVNSPAVAEQLKTLEAEQEALRLQELKAIDWKPLWGIPAIFAAVVMVFFALFFRERSASTDQLIAEQTVTADSASG